MFVNVCNCCEKRVYNLFLIFFIGTFIITSMLKTNKTVTGCSLNPAHGNVTVPTLTLTPGLTAAQGMCIEAILTFNLLFVVLCVTDPRRTVTIPAFPVALCLGCGIFAAVRKSLL